jgi:hypothetical protein
MRMPAWLLMGGTLTSSAAAVAAALVLPLGAWNASSGEPEPAVGTLLGPEGAGICPLGTAVHRPPARSAGLRCTPTVRTGRAPDGAPAPRLAHAATPRPGPPAP